MFCPQCGSTQDDSLKFCKQCGANLQALRQVMATRDSEDKFDWNRTWVREMFMSSEEAVKHKAEIERLQGKTPESKRLTEIKAGVITASLGIGLMILLFVLMGGIIASGRVSDAAAELLSRIWIAGIIPLFVGLALIVNGMFISKREKPEAEDPDTTEDGSSQPTVTGSQPVMLQQADTNPLGSDIMSVTEETTKHLKVPG